MVPCFAYQSSAKSLGIDAGDGQGVAAINVGRAGLARIACEVNDAVSRQQQEPTSVAAWPRRLQSPSLQVGVDVKEAAASADTVRIPTRHANDDVARQGRRQRNKGRAIPAPGQAPRDCDIAGRARTKRCPKAMWLRRARDWADVPQRTVCPPELQRRLRSNKAQQAVHEIVLQKKLLVDGPKHVAGDVGKSRLVKWMEGADFRRGENADRGKPGRRRQNPERADEVARTKPSSSRL